MKVYLFSNESQELEIDKVRLPLLGQVRVRIGKRKRTVAFRDLQLDTCVLGKIPLPLVARGALAGESGPAESLDDEIAVEASDSFIVGIEIRL